MEEGGGEMPVPLNTTYGGVGHMMHHHHDPQNHILPSNGPLEDHVPFKRAVRYRECLKNHAAAMGGSATDGCGEFMPSGGEGTLEAHTCSACGCHRNFHRKENEGDQTQIQNQNYNCEYFNRVGRKIIVGHHPHHKAILGPDSLGYPRGTAPPPPPPPLHHHHPMILSYNLGTSVPSESDDQEDCGGGSGNGGGGMNMMMNHLRPPHQAVKKRFRTKFTQEQKEKMLVFAEKVGWKIQKQEESVVQQFCQEVGVKRRVLKVWMHNNKHSLAKKSINMDMNIDTSVPIPNNIMIPPQNHVQNQA